ncbi:MAG: NADH-quinone oxidoreductase subunit L [Candidatus Omnitrophota bacterium]
MHYPWFKLDSLNGFIVLAIALFSVLILIYSWRFMKGRGQGLRYYTYIILTAASSIGAVLANNLILLAILWGFLGLTLYLLINTAKDDASSTAKKTLIIIGGTDALMLLGIGIIYYISGTMQIDKIRVALDGNLQFLPIAAYLCIAIACFAKAGAMPFHTWIPDCAEKAPIPVVAYLPASLDKLLGIYLLARLSLDLFILNQAINIFLMVIGAFTIIAAVMMALVQHNMKRLLGYHAVSQVGYMVLGIGTGTPIGIAGGIFHMLNHAVYKACLFLTAGNVEYRTKTSELDKLGGLAKWMPFTYICALIASLSISGIPPFNGFVSKWMVYQGLIERLSFSGGRLVTILCLAAAMVGSGLTLASFMKLLHATFLGQQPGGAKKRPDEVPWQMWLPCVVLAVICVLFGVFANQLPLKYFILPAVGGISFIGSWYAGLSTMLIVIGLLLGIFIFKLKAIKPLMRQDAPFVGAEGAELGENRVSGTEFYNTVKEFRGLAGIYAKAEKGYFDIYEQGKSLVFGIGRFFQFLHNGVLPTYLVWTLLGMIALFFVLMR